MRHQDHVLRVVGRVVRHRQDAEDIAAETFVRAWGSLSELRQPGMFRAWLNRIALNLSRNHIRDGKVRGRVTLLDREILEQSAVASPLDPAMDLRAALDALPAPFHRLLLEKYEAGYTYGEIAAREAVSTETVKDRLRKARLALEALLARRGLLDPRRDDGPEGAAPGGAVPRLQGATPSPRPSAVDADRPDAPGVGDVRPFPGSTDPPADSGETAPPAAAVDSDTPGDDAAGPASEPRHGL